MKNIIYINDYKKYHEVPTSVSERNPSLLIAVNYMSISDSLFLLNANINRTPVGLKSPVVGHSYGGDIIECWDKTIQRALLMNSTDIITWLEYMFTTCGIGSQLLAEIRRRRPLLMEYISFTDGVTYMEWIPESRARNQKRLQSYIALESIIDTMDSGFWTSR